MLYAEAMKAKRHHKAKRVAIKHAEIDEGIIPFIQWMNHFSGIFTRWSCEGERHNPEGYHRAYVTFYAEDAAVLAEFIFHFWMLVGEAGIERPTISVDLNPNSMVLHFYIHMERESIISLAKTCARKT